MFTPQSIERMIRATGGVEVTYGAVTTWGHRDIVEGEYVGEEGAGVYGTLDTLKVATGLLAGLKNNQPITVEGETFKVADHRRIEDGALTRIVLRK